MTENDKAKDKGANASAEDLAKKEKDLAALESALSEKSEQLDKQEKILSDREKDLDAREKNLDARDKKSGKGGKKTAPAKKELSASDKKLIEKACDKYGIKEDFVFASGIQDKDGKPEAVIVTNGGKKVRYADGDDVVPLLDVQITGISPNKPRKVIAGKNKKSKK